jgi:hypothetical protein
MGVGVVEDNGARDMIWVLELLYVLPESVSRRICVPIVGLATVAREHSSC